MKRRGWIIGLILFVLLFLYALAAGGCAKMYDRKLAAYDRNPVETTFVCPRGDSHQILLGVPKSANPGSYAGRLTVTDVESGETVCDFAFSAGGRQGCNWLDAYDLDGYILTWNDDAWHQNIKPKRKCRVLVHFDKSPPPGSSFWLVWVSSDLLSL